MIKDFLWQILLKSIGSRSEPAGILRTISAPNGGIHLLIIILAKRVGVKSESFLRSSLNQQGLLRLSKRVEFLNKGFRGALAVAV